jgi:hypothetical protein
MCQTLHALAHTTAAAVAAVAERAVQLPPEAAFVQAVARVQAEAACALPVDQEVQVALAEAHPEVADADN